MAKYLENQLCLPECTLAKLVPLNTIVLDGLTLNSNAAKQINTFKTNYNKTQQNINYINPANAVTSNTIYTTKAFFVVNGADHLTYSFSNAVNDHYGIVTTKRRARSEITLINTNNKKVIVYAILNNKVTPSQIAAYNDMPNTGTMRISNQIGHVTATLPVCGWSAPKHY